MNRFFVDLPLATSQTITLPDVVYRHWCKVLRAKIGDTAVLFNGKGGEFSATLSAIDKTSASVEIGAHHSDNRTPPHMVTLGQVMSKGDRMDYAIQKATELGVHRIQLLTSERCEMRLKYERDQKKLTHWQNIAIAACEQCGLNIVPEILPPMDVREWVGVADGLKIVMAVTDGKSALPTPLPERISLLIGAEGGLSADEIHLACEHGFIPWTIGERVLRTETATVVGLSALQVLAAISSR
ncbi:16S rRNA (uracil(1498)-N(3))-methyltransferase [Moraxella caviae]|uniref:Ribosomal RNA small subunit methyltransferase E n=1 Tax=Moraxella caviae TaxID=34060 RepID=A0A1S9ZW58_9GAMM|nr:16S rRNA (uracil(1498)-N(3))-methyltransferase [Moraxella caviae]OOR87647.1 16S rRNA (uracil(1498)-N(3))-methyltransferase [Moraxella caviae]STZ10106.1 Ribosomal RNA small subunit methyltransferase E [Moraxella caviae]